MNISLPEISKDLVHDVRPHEVMVHSVCYVLGYCCAMSKHAVNSGSDGICDEKGCLQSTSAVKYSVHHKIGRFMNSSFINFGGFLKFIL
jgi:hypothetical protein